MKKKLKVLNQKLDDKNKAIAKNNKTIDFLEKALLNKKMQALPKIPRLSWNAVQNIKSKILFVGDANEFSEKAVDLLKKRGTRFVVCKKMPSKKLQKKLPFPCTEAENYQESDDIVLVKKAWLDEVSKKTQILKKVIEEYQKRRTNV